MRLTRDDCPSISVSRLRALGEVTEEMARVRVTIAGRHARCGSRTCAFLMAAAGAPGRWPFSARHCRRPAEWAWMSERVAVLSQDAAREWAG
jgi:hypothetical protein